MTEPTTFDEAVKLIRQARTRAGLFGVEDQNRVYRLLVKLVHPDVAPDGCTDEAKDAFTKLHQLWSGTSTTVTTAGGVLTLYNLLGSDELADYLWAETEGETFFAKVARRPTDNDLFRRETENLQEVIDKTEKKHRDYLAPVRGSFPYRDTSGAERQVTLFEAIPDLYSLATVLEAFPHGLDARHVAWIWRRLLFSLGLAHHAGIVYGAVVPDHVLIQPEQHGLILSNWCYSAAKAQRIPAIVKRWRDDYPPEVLNKKPPSGHTDVYMASRVVLGLLDDDCPKPLMTFATDCLKSTVASTSTWKLLARLDDILSSVYGPRKFSVFPAMPTTAMTWPQTKE